MDHRPTGKTIRRLLSGVVFAAVISVGLAIPVLAASGAFSVPAGRDDPGDADPTGSLTAATSTEGGISAFVTVASAGGDADGDGLLTSLEAPDGCLDSNPDSDSDGLTDGQERVILGTRCDLADSDGDGFSDAFEMRMTGTATGGSATTLVDSTSSYPQPPASPTSTWATNQWPGFFVRIIGGTGAGQTRAIVSNTANTANINPAAPWATTPDATSIYVIQKVGTSPLLNCAADTIADNEDPDASPLDLNDDRSINILDVFALFPVWLSPMTTPGWDPRFDLVADGVINILDLFELFPAWATTCAP